MASKNLLLRAVAEDMEHGHRPMQRNDVPGDHHENDHDRRGSDHFDRCYSSLL